MIYTLNTHTYLIGSAAEEVAENIVEMLNDHQYRTLEEATDGEIDRWLIWTDNQWQIMKEYQEPESANYSEALEEFFNDVCSLISEEEEEDEAITIEVDGEEVEIEIVIDDQDAEEKSASVYYNGDDLSITLVILAGSSYESYLNDEAGAAELEEIQQAIRELKAEELKEKAIKARARYYLDAYRQGKIADIVNDIMTGATAVFVANHYDDIIWHINNEEEAPGEAADLETIIVDTLSISGVVRFFKYKKENDLTECSYYIEEGLYLNRFFYNDHLLKFENLGEIIEDWEEFEELKDEIRIYDYELNEEIEHFDL